MVVVPCGTGRMVNEQHWSIQMDMVMETIYKNRYSTMLEQVGWSMSSSAPPKMDMVMETTYENECSTEPEQVGWSMSSIAPPKWTW